MTATTWTKFYWSDWANDPKLKLCSLAAQGLWMRCLCIAAEADPTGYVTVNGNALGVTDIARLAGVTETEVVPLLAELDRNGVFSRARNGTIYSRRMVNDQKKARIARENGAKGGNPRLGNHKRNSASDNQQHNGRDKTHKPEARSQTESASKKALSVGWSGPAEIREEILKEKGEDFCRSYLDSASWLNGSIRPRSGIAALKLVGLDCLTRLGATVILPEGKAA